MPIGVRGWLVAENRRKEGKMEQCRGYRFSWPRSATLPLHSEGPTRSLQPAFATAPAIASKWKMQSVHTFHDRMKINVLDTTAINPVFIDSLIVVRLSTDDILRFTSNSCRYATIVLGVKIPQQMERSNYLFLISYKTNVSRMFSPNPAKSRSSFARLSRTIKGEKTLQDAKESISFVTFHKRRE